MQANESTKPVATTKHDRADRQLLEALARLDAEDRVRHKVKKDLEEEDFDE